jgi:hypothetical protein
LEFITPTASTVGAGDDRARRARLQIFQTLEKQLRRGTGFFQRLEKSERKVPRFGKTVDHKGEGQWLTSKK